MEKPLFQDLATIQQEEMPIIQQEEEVPTKKDTIDIETWRRTRYDKRNEHIRAVLSRTNYASLMQSFIQDDAQKTLYMRIAQQVSLDLGPIGMNDMDRAVGNKTYKMGSWKRGPYAIMGYSKDDVILTPGWEPNVHCLFTTLFWIISLIVLMFLGAIALPLCIAAWHYDSIVILNVFAILTCGLCIACSLITFLAIPAYCIYAIRRGSFDTLDVEEIHGYPVLTYQEV